MFLLGRCGSADAHCACSAVCENFGCDSGPGPGQAQQDRSSSAVFVLPPAERSKVEGFRETPTRLWGRNEGQRIKAARIKAGRWPSSRYSATREGELLEVQSLHCLHNYGEYSADLLQIIRRSFFFLFCFSNKQTEDNWMVSQPICAERHLMRSDVWPSHVVHICWAIWERRWDELQMNYKELNMITCQSQWTFNPRRRRRASRCHTDAKNRPTSTDLNLTHI